MANKTMNFSKLNFDNLRKEEDDNKRAITDRSMNKMRVVIKKKKKSDNSVINLNHARTPNKNDNNNTITDEDASDINIEDSMNRSYRPSAAFKSQQYYLNLGLTSQEIFLRDVEKENVAGFTINPNKNIIIRQNEIELVTKQTSSSKINYKENENDTSVRINYQETESDLHENKGLLKKGISYLYLVTGALAIGGISYFLGKKSKK